MRQTQHVVTHGIVGSAPDANVDFSSLLYYASF
jgi:hypothetical protein